MSTDSQRYEFSGVESMIAVANDPARIPKADEREIAWKNPVTGESELIDEAKAIYNERTGDRFGIVSDEYEVINAPEFVGPLAGQLNDRAIADTDGSFTLFDGGARGYAQVLLNDHAIWPRDRSSQSEPVRCGITFRWSHDGGISVRASGFAQDGACKNTMRQVTDSVYVKHAGDVGGRVDWDTEWEGVLNQLGAFSERLQTVIGEAMEFELFDLTDEWDTEWLTHTETLQMHDPHDPDAAERITPVGPLTPDDVLGLQGFYSYLGFPTYLADESVKRLLWRLSQRDDPTLVNAWDAYSALTFALTHRARFDAGSSSDDRYHRTASDVLANPAKALQDARAGLVGEMQPDDDDRDPLADFGIEENVGEAARVQREREQELRATFGGSEE